MKTVEKYNFGDPELANRKIPNIELEFPKSKSVFVVVQTKQNVQQRTQPVDTTKYASDIYRWDYTSPNRVLMFDYMNVP